MRMLTTLLPIDAGTATVAGFDVARHPQQVREHIGYVSQLGGADELATGRENLVLQGRLYGASSAEMHPRVEELAAVLDLPAFSRPPGQDLFGRSAPAARRGARHRPRPSVLFLDEPTTGLDPQNRANLWEHLRALRERGTTMVLTTHYLEEADVLCDRIVIVDHGRSSLPGNAT